LTDKEPATAKLRLFGASYSVYARIARLVLAECGQAYELVEVDIFDRENLPPDYLARQPFGKIPALAHEDFRLYETDAIAHYVNEALGAGKLMPFGPRPRARCLQVMRIVDNYAYPALVWGLYVAETEEERTGALDAAVLAQARKVLGVLEGLMVGPYFLGEKLSLADLWAIPVFAYLRLAPSGPVLMGDCPRLQAWCDVMAGRDSVQATRFPAEDAVGV
jgi:glutathione S-transferase